MITLRSASMTITKNESRADILRDFQVGDVVHFEFEFKPPLYKRRGVRYAVPITIVNENRSIRYRNTLNQMWRLLEKMAFMPERW